MTTESGWLIELPSTSKPLYLKHRDRLLNFHGWTRDAYSAFRWETKQEARTALESLPELPLGVQKHEVRVSEHMWIVNGNTTHFADIEEERWVK